MEVGGWWVQLPQYMVGRNIWWWRLGLS